MRLAARRLGLCLLFIAGTACWSASASQAFSEPETAGQLSLAGGLVVPGVQFLDEGQQLRAQREAARLNPVAVAERMASRTRFSGFSTAEAVNLAGGVFQRAIDALAGGLPHLSGVREVKGFPTDSAASVVLSDGRRGVVESLEPIAVSDGGGRRVPIDLALRATPGGFASVSPLVGVELPRRAGDGVRLSGSGVSLVPLGGAGAPVGGAEGVLEGASVVYANTNTDTDTVLKPSTFGFEADTILRSDGGPRQLAYRVVLPGGLRLVQGAGAGAVEVLDRRGVAVATVLPASAVDAAGTAVPVSMSVSGDVLTLAVSEGAGYQFPILVDPYVITDKGLTLEGSGKPTNWIYKQHPETGWKEEVGTGIRSRERRTTPAGNMAGSATRCLRKRISMNLKRKCLAKSPQKRP